MEDFVSFELAQMLKEKGFDWTCSHYYRTKSKDLFMIFPSEDWNNTEERINAPTISQVLKWLREEKKIHICIDIYDDGWFFDIASYYKEDTGVYEIKLPYKSSKVTPDYDSFEQAALAGIEYSLDNLI